MPLTIVADITANPGKEAQLRDALRGLIAPSLAERGCLQYDLHEDNGRPGHFLFYETWESRALWQDHMAALDKTDFGARTESAIEIVHIYEMTQIT